MKAYGYIYSIETVPEELREKHKNAPQYGDFMLLFQGVEEVTGIAPESVVDLVKEGLQADDAEGDSMTLSEFNEVIQSMMSETSSGIELQLSNAQVRYLYTTIFKPSVIDEMV